MKKRNYHCCYRVMYRKPELSGNLPDICAFDQSALIGTGNLQMVPDGGGGYDNSNDRDPATVLTRMAR